MITRPQKKIQQTSRTNAAITQESDATYYFLYPPPLHLLRLDRNQVTHTMKSTVLFLSLLSLTLLSTLVQAFAPVASTTTTATTCLYAAAPKKTAAKKKAAAPAAADEAKPEAFKKPDFVASVAEKTGLSKVDSEAALNAVLDTITEVRSSVVVLYVVAVVVVYNVCVYCCCTTTLHCTLTVVAQNRRCRTRRISSRVQEGGRCCLLKGSAASSWGRSWKT